MKQNFLIRLMALDCNRPGQMFQIHICVRASGQEEALERTSYLLARRGYTVQNSVDIEAVLADNARAYPTIEQGLLHQAKHRRQGIAMFLRKSLALSLE